MIAHYCLKNFGHSLLTLCPWRCYCRVQPGLCLVTGLDFVSAHVAAASTHTKISIEHRTPELVPWQIISFEFHGPQEVKARMFLVTLTSAKHIFTDLEHRGSPAPSPVRRS